MSKLQGISGGMSGRTGSFTFRQSRGQTIVSQYQPVVKNPNTEGQRNQRARFKLMSQLAAIMAPAFGTMNVATKAGKLSPSQRNAFSKINMPLVVVETIKEQTAATIPMDKLQLTTSFRNLPSVSLSQDNVNSTLSVEMQNITDNVKKVRVVLVGYGTMSITKASTDTQAYIQEIVDVPVEGGKMQHEFTEMEDGDYTVLAYGLIPTTSSASTKLDLDSIHTPADEAFISAVMLDNMVSEGEMVETITVGANVTVQSV